MKLIEAWCHLPYSPYSNVSSDSTSLKILPLFFCCHQLYSLLFKGSLWRFSSLTILFMSKSDSIVFSCPMSSIFPFWSYHKNVRFAIMYPATRDWPLEKLISARIESKSYITSSYVISSICLTSCLVSSAMVICTHAGADDTGQALDCGATRC